MGEIFRLETSKFADWRRKRFTLNPRSRRSASIVIGKGTNYGGSLTKVNWGTANKLEIYEHVATEGTHF
ncbi:hypothetical protein GCK32_021306, partial [Trichostrongylus colubriformis]